ncbi:MAG: hypothetical protein ABIJ61_14795, partial [bacterium]
MSVPEYLSMTLLIVLAFIVYQAKPRYFLAQPKCYRNLLIGLLGFLAIFLVRALGAAGTFEMLAGLNGPVLESLLQALFLIVGGMFAGVALVQWLPRLAAAQVQAQALHDQMSLIEALLAARARLTEAPLLAAEVAHLLKLVLRKVEIEAYHYVAESATLSPLERPEIEVGKHTGLHHFCTEALSSAANWYARSGIEGDHRALAAIPLSSDRDSSYLLLMVWPLGSEPQPDEEQLLRLLHGQFQEPHTAANAPSNLQPAFAQLRARLAGAERLADELVSLDAILRELTGHDLLRVAVFDERGLNVTQYALGRGQSVLTERDKSISTNSTRLAAMFAEPQVTVCDDLAQSQFSDDQWLATCGARRAVSIPLVGSDRVLAVVTLASSESDLTICQTEEFRRELVDALLPAVQADLLTQQSIAFNRRVLDLTATLKEVVESGGGERVLTSMTDTIVRQFPATAAQVWTFEATGDKFTLAAASYAHPVDLEIKDHLVIPAAESYW